jgi:hypothetical protein
MRIIISAIVIIILIIFLLLLIGSNNITETFITQKDLNAIKNYQGKVTDTYDTIDDPISDSLIPSNPKDTIKLSDYDVIEIYKNIYLRAPTIQEMQKYAYYTKEALKEFLYNSPEYDKLIKTQNNDVNNGIEGAIAKKNLINRIITIYSTVYKQDLPVKMMMPLRDCFIHLQLNEFLFTSMLESYNYKKFEVDVLSTYVLTKKVLLKLFNKHFNVLELKLVAQQKINDVNNQSNILTKQVENIKNDLLSVSSSVSNNDIVKNIIETIKLNYPAVYSELVKTTIKNGGTEETISNTTDINTLNSYLNNIEKYENYRKEPIKRPDDNFIDYDEEELPPPPPRPRPRPPRTNYDDYNKEKQQDDNFINYDKEELPPPPRPRPRPPRTDYDDYNKQKQQDDNFIDYDEEELPPPPRPRPPRTIYDDEREELPQPPRTNYDDYNKQKQQDDNFIDYDEEELPPPPPPPPRRRNDDERDKFKNYEDFKTIEHLELNTKTKQKIKQLDKNAELYVRVYKPMVHNNSYVLPSGYKPPICTSIGQPQLTQPIFTQSKLLFQGTDLNSAYKDTQVGSIMPKFIYKEYTDVKIN